jgi:hypothetical protein
VEILTLLDRAHAAGLSLSAEGDQLVIKGPRSADALARELIDRRLEVLPLLRLRGPRPTRWKTQVWSDPAEPPIELFGEIPDPSVGAAVSALSTRPVRWRCLSPFCRDGSRWWLSAHGIVQCLNCRPPAFPELIVAQGTLADAPLVHADRSTTAVDGGDNVA